jgi:hypothetical protein
MYERRVIVSRTSMKHVVNVAIRTALAAKPERREPYRTRVHHAVLAPGLDVTGFNRLADELEDEAIYRPG